MKITASGRSGLPAIKVAVLGTGAMGAPIARNLLGAGFSVRVWNRTQAKAAMLVAEGAQLAFHPSEAAAGADVLVTMLADGAAVKNVMTGPTGAPATLQPGAVWIQMSTVGVEWSDRLARLASGHQVPFVDAPVSGSTEPAERGELLILAACEHTVRSRVERIFDVLGRRTLWLERVGDGSRLKLAINNWLGVLVEGMAETISLSAALGLDPRLFLHAIAAGPLASEYAIAKGDAMLQADFVAGFPLQHAMKDAELASSAAHQRGVELPLTEAMLPRWQHAIALGHGGDDIASAVAAAGKIADAS